MPAPMNPAPRTPIRGSSLALLAMRAARASTSFLVKKMEISAFAVSDELAAAV
jgi:hypothetical protein